MSKTCIKCGIEKPLEEFYKRVSSKDGRRGECKACRRAWSAEWKKNNLDRAKMNARNGTAAWRQRNPEKVIKDAERFRLNNPEYQNQWNEANPEKRRGYSRKNYYENGGKDLCLRRNAKRRALLNGSSVSQYSVDEVVSLYGAICYLCGSEIDLNAPRWTAKEGWERGLHIDHYLPLILGGEDSIDNVRPTHGLCNIKKKGSFINE